MDSLQDLIRSYSLNHSAILSLWDLHPSLSPFLFPVTMTLPSVESHAIWLFTLCIIFVLALTFPISFTHSIPFYAFCYFIKKKFKKTALVTGFTFAIICSFSSLSLSLSLGTRLFFYLTAPLIIIIIIIIIINHYQSWSYQSQRMSRKYQCLEEHSLK